jgi:PPM family protein phosphatase
MEPQRDLDTGEYVALPSQAEAPPRHSVSASVWVDFGAQSHQGHVRANNEDHFLVARFERILETLLSNLSPGDVPNYSPEIGYAMLVADGLGGHAAGEVASRSAIALLVDLVLYTPDWILRLDEQQIREVAGRMEKRFRQVDEALAEQARADPNLSGMGTTMTLACSLGTDLLVWHVGDSRAYLCRGGQLHRLTRDHTLAQSLAELGVIRADEVATHQWRHVLTNALGTGGNPLQVDMQSLRLEDGDQLLLCTDGLTEMVPDEAIVRVLSSTETASNRCRTLVNLALAAGGKDNVTVIVAGYRVPKNHS